MGITAEVEDIESEIIKNNSLSWKDIKICELGCQFNSVHNKWSKDIYLTRSVIEHVCIDIHGLFNSLPIDLDFPVPSDFINRFDVITNYGTSEHVVNQYQCFKNIHDMLKINGLAIHALVIPGHWVGHGRYHYPYEFITGIGRLYKEVYFKEITIPSKKKKNRNLVMVAWKKINNNSFLSIENFQLLPVEDSHNNEHTGNYCYGTKT